MLQKNAIEYVQNMQTKGSKYGLSRTRNLLDALGSPDKKLKIVHVAGTNGKGSVCAYLTQGLISSKKNVGTFLSPEVYSYNEKFLVNGESMSNSRLNYYLDYVLTVAKAMKDEPTAFEIEVATALYAFVDLKLEYCVLECGLGGREDSTNAIAKKTCSVITNVTLEHTSVLGDTIEQICYQKAGIIKQSPCFTSVFQNQSTLDLLSEYGVIACGQGVVIDDCKNGAYTFTYKGQKFWLSMLSKTQVYNALVAIDVLLYLGFELHKISQGIKEAKILGRIEIINKSLNATYILDGAHNEDSVRCLVEYLKHSMGDKSLTLVFGCLSDKDVDAMARQFSDVCFTSVKLVLSNSYRAMDMNKMKKAFSTYFKVESYSSVGIALDDSYGACIVCGSFTLLKEAKEWIERR